MHIIRTWAELEAQLNGPPDPDIQHLLRLRRDELMDYGELPDLGTFTIIQPGDTLADIETLLQLEVMVDGAPTWEWVKRHGSIYEAPIIISDDGFGHVLIIPDTEGIDARLLALCRERA